MGCRAQSQTGCSSLGRMVCLLTLAPTTTSTRRAPPTPPLLLGWRTRPRPPRRCSLSQPPASTWTRAWRRRCCGTWPTRWIAWTRRRFQVLESGGHERNLSLHLPTPKYAARAALHRGIRQQADGRQAGAAPSVRGAAAAALHQDTRRTPRVHSQRASPLFGADGPGPAAPLTPLTSAVAEACDLKSFFARCAARESANGRGRSG